MGAFALFIDGKRTNLLGPVQAKAKDDGTPGNTYFGFETPRERQYGVILDSSELPNGLSSVFSVGTDADKAIVIPVQSSKDGDRRVLGDLNIEVNGKPMKAHINLLAKDEPGLFNLTARVTNKPKAKIKKGIYASA